MDNEEEDFIYYYVSTSSNSLGDKYDNYDSATEDCYNLNKELFDINSLNEEFLGFMNIEEILDKNNLPYYSVFEV